MITYPIKFPTEKWKVICNKQKDIELHMQHTAALNYVRKEISCNHTTKTAVAIKQGNAI